MNRFTQALVAACCAAAGLAAAQGAPQQGTLQQPIYRCPGPNGVVFTHAPCAGGTRMGEASAPAKTDRRAAPPQDRARQMARAQLPPETREQCAVLDTEIADGEAKARAMNATPAEEGQLAMKRIRYRELRC